MNIDISELEMETQRECSLINLKSIKINNQKLSFSFVYMEHLPSPFSSYYDPENKEFHIIIQRDAFTMSSYHMNQEFDLPEDTKKIKIDYRGNDIDKLSNIERLKLFFPKLGSGDVNNRDEKGIDRSGYDGWMNTKNY